MEGNDINRKKGGLALIAVLGIFALLFYIRGCFFTVTAVTEEENNDTIITIYTNRYIINSQKFNFMAKAVRLSKYNGAMWLSYSDGYHLSCPNGNLDSVYPYLGTSFTHYFGDDEYWGQRPEMLAKDGFVIIATPYCFNDHKHKVAYVYCPGTEKELLDFFNGYKFFCDTDQRKGRCKWLHKLSDHWYICSPAQNGLKMLMGKE